MAEKEASAPEASAETSPSEKGTTASPEGAAPTSAAAPVGSTVSTVATTDAGSPTTGPSATKASVTKARPSYVFLVVVTVVNLVADLWSKHWAKSHFESVRPGGSRKVVVIEDVMNFIFAKNRGGAWGLLQDETEALRRPFFLIVSVAAIVFIVSLYRKLQPGQTALKWGLPLVLGGALGNLVDRIRYGYVVDFIDVYMNIEGKVRHWPTFNVADISICVGVALMAIDMFTSRAPNEGEKPSSTPTPSTKPSETSPSAVSAGTPPPAGAAGGDASERA